MFKFHEFFKLNCIICLKAPAHKVLRVVRSLSLEVYCLECVTALTLDGSTAGDDVFRIVIFHLVERERAESLISVLLFI